jgi:predicted nucleic-acid-binding protein
VIGLDTNVLARYYISDESDPEAGKQRKAARSLMESGAPLMVCKTVILEFEWVMRGYYEFSPADTAKALNHLFSLAHVTIEERESVRQALAHAHAGLEFADAIHYASYRECTSIVSFDDKKFARRVRRLGLSPNVTVPA